MIRLMRRSRMMNQQSQEQEQGQAQAQAQAQPGFAARRHKCHPSDIARTP